MSEERISLETSTARPRGIPLGELARHLGAEILGGGEGLIIQGFATLGSAGPDDISFVANRKALSQVPESRAGAFLVESSLGDIGRPAIRAPEIWEAVGRLIERFHPRTRPEPGIHPSAVIGFSCEIAPEVSIAAGVVVGNHVRIGRRTVLQAGCTIGDHSSIGEECLLHAGVHVLHSIGIGDRVVLHSGAVVGSDGFRFEKVEGRWKKIPQVGTIVIESDVEIGANCTIDRAFLDETRIGAGTKVDNQVQVAHNVQIGKDCLLVAQSGLAGSSVVGDGCILAARAGVKDNVRIGDGVVVGGGGSVYHDIPDGKVVSGTPATDVKEWARITAATQRLPDMVKKIRELEKRLAALENGPPARP